MELCVLWYLYFDIYLSSFQEMARSWYWGRMGNCQVRRTKYNIHWLSWHFDSTGCSKIGGFLLGNWILIPLNFKSTQCGLGCLHSGVSRILELYWKGIVLLLCVFLSDSPNTREFGIIWDLEQCLSAFIYFYLLNWLMASFCSHCQKFPTTPLPCTWLFQVLVVVNDNRTVPLHLLALPALQTDSIWTSSGLLWHFCTA